MHPCRYGLLGLIVMAIAAVDPAPLLSQAPLPRQCYAIADSASMFRHPPTSNELIRALRILGSLRRALGAGIPPEQVSPDTLALNAFWTDDSGATELGLAELTVNPEYSALRDSRAAALQYRRLSGRPEPIIGELLNAKAPAYQPPALLAIRRLSDDTQQRAVFYLACNAMWRLNAFAADRAYQKLWRAAYATAGFDYDGAILTQSTRLLSGSRRLLVVEAIKRLPDILGPIAVLDNE